MLKVSIALILVPLLTISCGKKEDKGSESGAEVGSTPKVESQVQPEAETMQGGGDTPVPVEPDPTPDLPATLNAPGTLDLRPNAPLTASFPAMKSIDPRTYVPTGRYVPGGGKMARNILSGQIAVPSDGRSHVLPACANPFPAPGNTTTSGLTVDGNLSEWPVGSVIAVDKSGDAGNAPSDLKEVYFAKDNTSMYFGVKVNGTVTNAGSVFERVAFIFSALDVPSDATTLPTATQTFVLEAWGPNLKDVNLDPYAGSGTIYNIAASTSSIELRLNIDVVESLMNGSPYVVEVIGLGRNPSGTWIRDNTGNHMVGLVDDYACMVDLPNPDRTMTKSKMFVMRRTDSSIDAGTAEVIYRSMVHGSRAAEYVAKDHMSYWDTIAFTVIKDMASAGLNTSNAGIYMEDDITNGYGQTGDTTYLTFVSAHEYLHSYNAPTYQLAENWMTEGHSNWLATRAIGSYFGEEVTAQWFGSDMRSFLEEEEDNGVQTIANNAWGASPYSGLFYYRKAATYFELLQTKIDYSSFLSGILRVGVNSTPFTDRDAFLAAYKALPNYNGNSGDNLTAGWWGGSYSSSVFTLGLLGDTDNDGLLNFQETALGTSASSVDSDGDNATDLFEKIIGLNPLVSQNVTYLAQDNSLADWAALAPSWLHSTVHSRSSNVACGDFTKLVRYGVVVKEGWVYISAELQRAPTTSEDLKLLTFVNGGPQQFYIEHGKATVWHANPHTRPADLMLPFTGASIEIAYNTAWLGWSNGVMPPGTTFNVATFTGSSTQCDLGVTIAP